MRKRESIVESLSLNRDRLLSHLKGDEREIGARAVDLAERALAHDEPVASDFLDPLQQQVVLGVVGSIPGIEARAYGGHYRAERRRLVVYPDNYLVELIEEPVEALEVLPDDPAGLEHRDYLGALLSLGVKREKVGDVIVTPRGGQAVVAAEIASFLAGSVDRVGRHRAVARLIDLEQLEVAPERVKEIRTTVASLRLDAVAASGFGVSRAKMAREIKAARVKVNWEPVTSPAREVRPGDVISIRGRGRVIVESQEGTTRKGRLGLVLKRTL